MIVKISAGSSGARRSQRACCSDGGRARTVVGAEAA
jgi:hypothetical protein